MDIRLDIKQEKTRKGMYFVCLVEKNGISQEIDSFELDVIKNEVILSLSPCVAGLFGLVEDEDFNAYIKLLKEFNIFVLELSHPHWRPIPKTYFY